MNKWKIGLLTFGGVAACAACCAPLLTVPAALVASGFGLSASGLGYLLCGDVGLMITLLDIGGGAFAFWRWRAAKTSAAVSCACPPTGGCHTGDACDLPAASA